MIRPKTQETTRATGFHRPPLLGIGSQKWAMGTSPHCNGDPAMLDADQAPAGPIVCNANIWPNDKFTPARATGQEDPRTI